jgi:hypothetical protein
MPPAATVPATVLTVALVLLVAGPATADATEWTVKQCVLESSRQPLPDGYQQTTVHFTVTPRSVALVSAAPLDGGAQDVGLKVDAEAFVRPDRVEDRKALFDSKAEHLIAQFKAGGTVRVQLRFWPTWPATGTHAATMSLIGFTRAYEELSACR